MQEICQLLRLSIYLGFCFSWSILVHIYLPVLQVFYSQKIYMYIINYYYYYYFYIYIYFFLFVWGGGDIFLTFRLDLQYISINQANRLLALHIPYIFDQRLANDLRKKKTFIFLSFFFFFNFHLDLQIMTTFAWYHLKDWYINICQSVCQPAFRQRYIYGIHAYSY